MVGATPRLAGSGQRRNAGDRSALIGLGTQLRWLLRNRRSRELATTWCEHAPRAIEVLAAFDALARPAAEGAARRQLQEYAAQAQGVVAGDDAAVLEAADRADRAPDGQRAPRRRLARAHREARVVPDEVPRQERVRRGDLRDPGKTQLADQAVLEGAPEALDATFGLRRRSEHHLHLELGEGPAELGRLALSGQLLRGALALAVRAPEDAVPVAVHRQRHAALKELAQHLEVPGDVLLLAECRTEHLAGGVVNGPEQRGLRPIRAEPAMPAAIELGEHPGRGAALAAAAVAGGPMPPRTGNPRVAQHAPHTRARHRDPFALGEELGQMAVVAARVRRRGQRHDAARDLRIEAVRGTATGIPMHQRPGSVREQLRAEPPDRALRASEEQCRLSLADLPRDKPREHQRASFQHGDPVLSLPVGWTESRSSLSGQSLGAITLERLRACTLEYARPRLVQLADHPSSDRGGT